MSERVYNIGKLNPTRRNKNKPMGAESYKGNGEGERTTYLVPMRRRITMAEGSHHVVLNEMFLVEVTAFLRQKEEFKIGRVGWEREEQKKEAKSTKELNKAAIKFRGAQIEHFGRSGGKREAHPNREKEMRRADRREPPQSH